MEGLEYIIQIWEELGLSASNGMGHVPFSFLEIYAYSKILSGALREFEVSAIRKMSERYCRGISNGKDKMAFPPYTENKEEASSKWREAKEVLKKR